MNAAPFVPPVADTPAGRQFAQDGYLLVRGVFSPAETAELEGEFDRIVAQLASSGEEVNAAWGGPSTGIVLHTHNVQQYSAVWLRALLHPGFLDAARAILGDDVVLHHTKLFQKPPEKGAPFPMHQDWEYFPTIGHSMLAAVVHVSPATDEMGCLRVYPGSHRAGPMDDAMGAGHGADAFPLDGATPVPAEPGDVLFFHYFLIHGSRPNRSAHTRKTVLVQLHRGDDRVVDGNLHPDERLALSGWNHWATRSRANEAH